MSTVKKTDGKDKKFPRITMWPPQDLTVTLEGSGRRLSTVLRWKPPLVNKEEVGGYLIERKVWWPGVPPQTKLLTQKPVQGCSFVDNKTVPDRINEYRVCAVHRRFPRVYGNWGFPAAVYGFAFMRYREMVAELKRFGERYPEVCRIVDAGPAAVKNYRVWCAVLGTDTSDMADRPGLFLAGNPHASEVEGGDMCMGLVRETLRRWEKGDRVIRKILEGAQIRIIPLYNPCGRSSNEAGFPGGVRKNMPARLLKPHHDPLQAADCWRADTGMGLDPNRTFDFGWEQGGNKDMKSSTYPGRHPFAAPETRALVRMARALRPQISVNYHGPCGYPLLTADLPDGTRPVDRPLQYEIGREFAKRSDPAFADDIPEESPHPTELQTGLAQNWFYKEFYGVHLLPEGFYGQVPIDPRLLPVAGSESIRELVERNMEAMVWMAERLHGSILVVHVRNSRGHPLKSEVRMPGHMNPYCLPQKTGKRYGDYRRIISPGVYKVEIAAHGYRSKKFRVEIVEDKPTLLDVVLKGEKK